MKRILTLFVVVLYSIALFPQPTIDLCTCVDGIWSPWKSFYATIYGNYSQISAFREGHHPSEFIWRVTINNFYKPYKATDWLEFSGTMEYYITDEFPNAKSQFLDWRQKGFVVVPWEHNVSKGEMPCVKKTSKAIIKIAPYKKRPKVYNIFFEDVAFAIDLNNLYFKE